MFKMAKLVLISVISMFIGGLLLGGHPDNSRIMDLEYLVTLDSQIIALNARGHEACAEGYFAIAYDDYDALDAAKIEMDNISGELGPLVDDRVYMMSKLGLSDE